MSKFCCLCIVCTTAARSCQVQSKQLDKNVLQADVKRIIDWCHLILDPWLPLWASIGVRRHIGMLDQTRENPNSDYHQKHQLVADHYQGQAKRESTFWFCVCSLNVSAARTIASIRSKYDITSKEKSMRRMIRTPKPKFCFSTHTNVRVAWCYALSSFHELWQTEPTQFWQTKRLVLSFFVFPGNTKHTNQAEITLKRTSKCTVRKRQRSGNATVHLNTTFLGTEALKRYQQIMPR